MYGLNTTFGAPFDETVHKVIFALTKEDLAVPGDMDVQATLKLKLGVEFAPHRILGVCNPSLAHQALQEFDIGLLPDTGSHRPYSTQLNGAEFPCLQVPTKSL